MPIQERGQCDASGVVRSNVDLRDKAVPAETPLECSGQSDNWELTDGKFQPFQQNKPGERLNIYVGQGLHQEGNNQETSTAR